jgi:hypothetical protein
MSKLKKTPPGQISSRGGFSTFPSGQSAPNRDRPPLNPKTVELVPCLRFGAKLLKQVCADRWSGVVQYQLTKGLVDGCKGCKVGEERYKEIIDGSED